MNSYNNKPHYTIFHVLLLLTPSTGQIFSWQLFSHSPGKNPLFLPCKKSHFTPI